MGTKGYMAGRMDRTPYTEMHDNDDNDDDDDGKGICCTTRLSASTDAHDGRFFFFFFLPLLDRYHVHWRWGSYEVLIMSDRAARGDQWS
jgi:hypothetical protein